MSDDTCTSDSDLRKLESLEKDDTFRVDCHDRPLRVHSNAEFMGAIVLDAYDDRGAHWPVGEVDGSLYLGYSQLRDAGDQPDRVKRIRSVSLPSESSEQSTLIPDGGENDRTTNVGERIRRES